MNTSFPLLALTGMLAALGFLSEGQQQQGSQAVKPAALARQTSSSDEHDGRTYRLGAPQFAGECTVGKGAALAPRRFELTATPGCEGLLAGLSHARFWLERPDGAVVFSKNGTDPIVTFSVADGVAYESFRPRTALISMAVAD